MKILYIAFKDLTRSLRSMFLLAFMFAIPLLVTGMFYLMFGNTAATQGSQTAPAVALPRTRVVIATLDQGSPLFSAGVAQLSGGAGGLPAAPSSLGEVFTRALQSDALAALLDVSSTADAAAARRAVEDGQVAAAVIIPPDFTAAYVDPASQAEIEVYQPASGGAGAAVVQAVLGRLVDQFAGMKIAVGLTMRHAPQVAGGVDYTLLGNVVRDYTRWSDLQFAAPSGAGLAELHTPAAAAQPANPMAGAIGGITAGMLVFFAFFTGSATAQTILKEQEEGTLARLFTTPTPLPVILGGKFLAVGLTVLVQVTVLLAATALVFGLPWGDAGAVALTAAGIVLGASAFGICLASLLKDTRQAGIVTGGFVTVTGMLGMLGTFLGPGLGETVSLVVPQGWAVRGLLLGLNGAVAGEAALTLLALLAWSGVFFAIGVLRFQKRFA